MKTLPITSPLIALALAFTHTAEAQQSWTGGVDSAWGEAMNWTPNGVPAGGPLSFGSATRYTIDLGGVIRSADGLTFNAAAAYTLESGGIGGVLQLGTGAGLTQSGSGAVGFDHGIAFSGSSARIVGGEGVGELHFSGALTRTSGDLNFLGNHTVTLSGAAVNALGSGSITIGGGTPGHATILHLSRSTTAAQNAALGTGTINLNKGTLRISNSSLTLSNNLQVGSGNGAIEADVAFTLNGQLMVNAARVVTWSNTQKATVNGNVTTSGSSTTSTRVFSIAGEGDVDFNGSMTESAVNKPMAVNKTGTGIIRSNGDNNYTGTTGVTAGTLLINGTSSGQGSFTVSGTGTLGGTGRIGLNESATLSLTSSNAALSPGDGAIGVLTIDGGGVNATAGLLLNAGTLLFDIDGSTSDRIVLTGFADGAGAGSSTADIGGIEIDFQGAVATTGEYELIQFATVPGILADRFVLSSNALGAGWEGNFRYEGNSLVFEAIPEPTTGALLVFATGLTLLRVRSGLRSRAQKRSA